MEFSDYGFHRCYFDDNGKFVGMPMTNSPQHVIMMDDGAGMGDMVACCPVCGAQFAIPIRLAFAKVKPKYYPCRCCGQNIYLKSED